MIVVSPDNVILRGSLGLSATAYFDKVSQGKTTKKVVEWDITQLTVLPRLQETFGEDLPDKSLWYWPVSDPVIENHAFGDACSQRHHFYMVSGMTSTSSRTRDTYIMGSYELIMIYYHILACSKFKLMLNIWKEGKAGSLAPKGYVGDMVVAMGKRSYSEYVEMKTRLDEVYTYVYP